MIRTMSVEFGLKLGGGYDLHLNPTVALQLGMDVIYGTKSEMADFVPNIGLAFSSVVSLQKWKKSPCPRKSMLTVMATG